MNTITRFNPTTNGPLHLGHIFTVLVNEYMAHRDGGKFLVRFDDRSPTTRKFQRPQLERIMEGQRETLDWLKIDVDDWCIESEIMSGFDIKGLLRRRGHTTVNDDENSPMPYFSRFGPSYIPVQYIAQATAERVALDEYQGVTDIIRGEEFSTELSLYYEYCRRWELRFPNFYFLARLTGKHGDISKTNGGYTIDGLKGLGWTPLDIKKALGKACLYWPGSGWDIYNVKPTPYIDL